MEKRIISYKLSLNSDNFWVDVPCESLSEECYESIRGTYEISFCMEEPDSPDQIKEVLSELIKRIQGNVNVYAQDSYEYLDKKKKENAAYKAAQVLEKERARRHVEEVAQMREIASNAGFNYEEFNSAIKLIRKKSEVQAAKAMEQKANEIHGLLNDAGFAEASILMAFRREVENDDLPF